MRGRNTRRQGGVRRGWLVGAALIGMIGVAADAGAMCCVCRDCGGAAFCVDGVANALGCSTLCVEAGCVSTVYDSADSCTGGCDGAPEAPTATASPTVTETPTASATATATETATPVDTATATASATAPDTPTPTATPTDTATPTETATPLFSATATATATASATATPTGPPQLAGQIAYYVGDGPVPDVTVAQIGDTPGIALSDGGGTYGFPVAGPGNVTLQPQKLGQFNAAVTSLDATWVLQAVAGTRTLTPEQQLAADVTGNGTFSTFDAALMLQFQAGIISGFDAAKQCGSDWLFVPVPSPTPNQTLVQPQVVGGICQPGRIALTSFAPPLAGRNFRAILIGDVTGNWAP